MCSLIGSAISIQQSSLPFSTIRELYFEYFHLVTCTKRAGQGKSAQGICDHHRTVLRGACLAMREKGSLSPCAFFLVCCSGFFKSTTMSGYVSCHFLFVGHSPPRAFACCRHKHWLCVVNRITHEALVMILRLILRPLLCACGYIAAGEDDGGR